MAVPVWRGGVPAAAIAAVKDKLPRAPVRCQEQHTPSPDRFSLSRGLTLNSAPGTQLIDLQALFCQTVGHFGRAGSGGGAGQVRCGRVVERSCRPLWRRASARAAPALSFSGLALNDMVKQSALADGLLELRYVVASIGEANRWWRSTFLSPTGFSFLQRVYPRTFVAAAVRSASEAARLEHDARIGRGQVVHLFRLPAALERTLDDALRGLDGSAQAKHREVLVAPQGPLDLLRQFAAGRTVNGGTEGPINCGSAMRLQEPAGLPLLAAHYLAGFEAGRQVYPYFEMGTGR